MKVGFTGTREWLTEAQTDDLTTLLKKLKPDEVHHGDCVGADAQFQQLCFVTIPQPLIVCHPPDVHTKRAFTRGNHVTRLPSPYHARNRRIVNLCDVLIGCPKDATRKNSGGTWTTIAYAESKGKPRYVILPDGTVIGPKD